MTGPPAAPIELNVFAENLREETLAAGSVEDQEEFSENTFTARVLEYLAEAGELEDAEVVHYRAHGAKLNGYVLNVEAESLDLVTAIYTGSIPPEPVDKAQVDQAFRQLVMFLQRARKGLQEKLEEASGAFEAAAAIRGVLSDSETVSRVRFFLITDGIIKVRNPDEIIEEVSARDLDLKGFQVSYHIWDIERLFRWYTSGQAREEIDIDLVALLGKPLPCLAMPGSNGVDHDTFLAFLPGSFLADIYGRFGARLLERNVRSFLQAKGAVNKGIRKTLLEEPGRFLAYNNGLTATAGEVEFAATGNGGEGISRLKDFQIVNGGQTTASLFHASRKDSADLSSVAVQLKLTLVRDREHLDEVVARISQCANSQNKVNVADFSANDPFHRRLETYSRTVWAPAKGGSQRQTRWFYERARGQYADDRARAGTPAKIREFELINPRAQMFTKTDMAKFENTWMQRPQWVSRGAQKNFSLFTLELSKNSAIEPSEEYFQRLVAKALLFRRAEKLIQAEQYGGYRANIVTYTLALLSHKSSQRIPLDGIWTGQEVPQALEKLIATASGKVHTVVVNPPGGRNVTEWCKSDACWEAVQKIDLDIPKSIPLISSRSPQAAAQKQEIAALTEEEQAVIARAAAVPSTTWFEMSGWAKATHNLLPWQRALSYSLGRIADGGHQPSFKQAKQGLIALEKARGLGFQPSPA